MDRSANRRFAIGRVDLVLNGDVGAVALAVLRGQDIEPDARQACAEADQRVGFDGQGDAAAERLQSRDADREGYDRGGLGELCRDGGVVGARELMEHRDMGGEEIAGGREMGGAEAVEPGLVVGSQSEGHDEVVTRGELVARWLALTRVVLPGMAVGARWPIRLDHCFMRVLLDNTLEGVWHHTVKRPAIKHLSPALLAQAIGLASGWWQSPGCCPF